MEFYLLGLVTACATFVLLLRNYEGITLLITMRQRVYSHIGSTSFFILVAQLFALVARAFIHVLGQLHFYLIGKLPHKVIKSKK